MMSTAYKGKRLEKLQLRDCRCIAGFSNKMSFERSSNYYTHTHRKYIIYIINYYISLCVRARTHI